MRFLHSTGNAVRVGLLVAILWAGVLWCWHKVAAARESGWWDARSEKLAAVGASDVVFAILDERQRSSMEAWEFENPRPSEPMPLWPDGTEWWAVVMGAYVVLVVFVQLKNASKG